MTYTLERLAQATGIPGRRIRYYISERLLPGPTKQGRGANYTESHLQRLRDILRMQGEGNSLAEILALVSLVPGGVDTNVLPQSDIREEFDITEDVRVAVRGGRTPHRKRRILRAMETFSKALINVDEEI